ncbi:MAG: L,D-transpeptidase [Nanoarchaeota archaeon]
MRKRFLIPLLALSLGHGASGLEVMMPNSVREERVNSLELTVTGANEKNLRSYIMDEIHANYPSIRVFGCYLDQIENHLTPFVEYIPPDSTFAFTIDIPKYFFREEIGVWVKIKRKEKTLELFSTNPKDSLLFKTDVALGGRHENPRTGKEQDFFTARGTYFFNRIVKDPWWYPDDWSEYEEPFPPGVGNPFGGWMTELARSPVRGLYDFKAARNQTGMRIHSTWYSPRFHYTISTHGCVRMQKDAADEIFHALLRYLPHREPMTTNRGTIYPLLTPIKVVICDE